MDAFEEVVEFVLEAASDDDEAEVEEVDQHAAEVEPLGDGDLGALGGQEAGHVDVEVGLQGGVLEEVGHGGLDIGARAEFEGDADVVGAEVLDVGELGDLTATDEVSDAEDEGVFFDSVGDRGDEDLVLFLRVALVGASELNGALAGGVDLPDLIGGVENDPGGGEIGALNVLEDLLEGDIPVAVEEGDDRLADLTHVVRRDVRGHPDGDAGGAVDDQVWHPRGQDRRLLDRAGVVRTEIDGLLAKLDRSSSANFVSRHSVYRYAAGGSPSIDPKLP